MDSTPTYRACPPPNQREAVFRLDCVDHDEPRLINFFEPEYYNGRTFRWSEPVAMVRIDIDPGNYEVTLDTGALRGAACSFPFDLHWNNHPIPPRTMTIREGQISFVVERSMFALSGEQRLTITARALKAENGRRQLGLPLCSVTLCAAAPLASDRTGEAPTKRRGGRIKQILARATKKKSPAPTIPIWDVKIPDLGRPPISAPADEYPCCPCDEVVVSSVEINSRHGTGLLIQYLVGDFSRVATVNSKRVYNGERVRSAAHYFLPNADAPRHEIYSLVHQWFRRSPPKRAYVVPYFESDLLIGMALKDLFRTSIGLHIMDDNCLFQGEISPATCEEAIEKADLVFAISPELRQAYEQRFGRKIFMLPPIVPDELIPPEVVVLATSERSAARRMSGWWQAIRRLWRGSSNSVAGSQRGILIGNIWDRSWLERLRTTIRDSGLQIDWFSNNPEAVWLKGSTQDLAKDGIHLQPALWGEELVAEMRRRPYALMPTGQLDQDEKRESIARLSLPSRVPFAIATAHLPVVVLGSEQTSAARFVVRFQLGATASYEPRALRTAVETVCHPQAQRAIRERAHALGRKFSASGVGAWMWQSLDQGQLVDRRFEDIFPTQSGEFQWYFDAPPPRTVNWSFRSTWQLLDRLRCQGLAPAVILDIGASTGIWSWTAAQVFPNAHFVLVDPLFSAYGSSNSDCYVSQLSKRDIVEAAIADRNGEMEILISDDLYGSSLYKVDETIRSFQRRTVPTMTLDDLAQRLQLRGPALLKIDVQFAEHLVLMGGRNFLRNHVQAIVMELTLEREHPEAKTYREMLDLAAELGYCLVDENAGWRNPRTGRLEQKDSVFVRHELATANRAA